MRITRRQLRCLVSEELRLKEARGNVQSEPEFGALLDAFQALEDKGFMADEIMTALKIYMKWDVDAVANAEGWAAGA